MDISSAKQIFRATILTPFLMWINALRLTCFRELHSELSCDVLCGGYLDISYCSVYLRKSKDTPLHTGLTTKTTSHGGTPWLIQGLTTCSCASLGPLLHSVFMLLLGQILQPAFNSFLYSYVTENPKVRDCRADLESPQWHSKAGLSAGHDMMGRRDSNGVPWLTGPAKCLSFWIWHCFASRGNSNKLVGVL